MVKHRKVLQGIVNNFCQMFVGYQSYMDVQDTLMPLSQGKLVRLEINVLTGQCVAEGQKLLPLKISEVMRAWFAARLVQHSISPSSIEVAQLTVEYQAKEVELKNIPRLVLKKASLWDQALKIFGREPSNNIFFKPQPGTNVWHIESEFFCRGLIRTSDHEYTSTNGKRRDKPQLPAT